MCIAVYTCIHVYTYIHIYICIHRYTNMYTPKAYRQFYTCYIYIHSTHCMLQGTQVSTLKYIHITNKFTFYTYIYTFYTHAFIRHSTHSISIYIVHSTHCMLKGTQVSTLKYLHIPNIFTFYTYTFYIYTFYIYIFYAYTFYTYTFFIYTFYTYTFYIYTFYIYTFYTYTYTFYTYTFCTYTFYSPSQQDAHSLTHAFTHVGQRRGWKVFAHDYQICAYERV